MALQSWKIKKFLLWTSLIRPSNPSEIIEEIQLAAEWTNIYKSWYKIKSIELQFELSNASTGWNDWWIQAWCVDTERWSSTWPQIQAHIPQWSQWWYQYAPMNQYWWISSNKNTSGASSELYIVWFTSSATTSSQWACRVIFYEDHVEYHVWKSYWTWILEWNENYTTEFSNRVSTLFNWNKVIGCNANGRSVNISRRKAIITYTSL